MINRRGFLGSLLALVAAPFAKPAAKPLGLAFHPNAFAMVSKPLVDREVGIAIRMMQGFDIEAARRPSRYDGFVYLGPSEPHGVRILES